VCLSRPYNILKPTAGIEITIIEKYTWNPVFAPRSAKLDWRMRQLSTYIRTACGPKIPKKKKKEENEEDNRSVYPNTY
jgi:hypothetical protein